MLIYHVRKPELWLNTTQLSTLVLYSGHGAGLNNPDLEHVHNVGPIPRGRWTIVRWFDLYEGKGPHVAQLAPVGHKAFGRSGFLIHGDNSYADFSASHGCIIDSRVGTGGRLALRSIGETALMVVD